MFLGSFGLDENTHQHYSSLSLEDTFLGRVLSSDGKRSHVMTEKGERIPNNSGKLRTRPEGPPVVGDWVVLKEVQGTISIVMVLPRRTRISRKAPGKATSEQLVAANIDTIFVMMGMDGDFNLRRLERYLVMISSSGAEGLVLLNKCDIAEDPDAMMSAVLDIAGNIPVLMMSALNGTGVEEVEKSLVPGRTICLLGSSGSGKSTLINRLLGEERIRTSSVGNMDKGRHTTTSRELYLLRSGALIIDNPGIRELQLWAEDEDIDNAFADIQGLSENCRFKDCQHLTEPDCAILNALENGELSRERYESYQKMKRELHHTRMRADMSAASAEKARWRSLKKDIRHYQRYKRER
ncbi:MAG: ribosome small subunit-dependent GTPase A [Candidatus Thermoplasmatota archaeon]|jgi:ribosome biogenesis GTPase|nr:ribosome small subunit-dependent GTPase A [Candidatus Thermoplasmatota archaeon]